MRTTWCMQIHIFSLVALEFILKKKTFTEGKRPLGYKRGNVFGCPCGDGIEGPNKWSLTDRVVNGYDPNKRAWMVFMNTTYNGQVKMYE